MSLSRPVANWRIKKRRQEITTQTLCHILLSAGAIVFIFPFAWMVSTSLKNDAQIFLFPPPLIPNPIEWGNYVRMVNYLPFVRFIGNTAYVTALNLVGTLLSSSLIAYGFARLRFKGREILFLLLLSTMMLPPQVTMVPLYLIFKRLNWIDTFKPLWVRAFFGTPFYVFLLRQFFMTIPYDLEDAAKIDGCDYFQIYGRIMLPLLKPALGTVAIYTFMDHWNEFLGPLIYLNSVEKMTISIGLRLYQQLYGGEWSLMMAAATVMTAPSIILFFFTQRVFIQGITLTGMKE